MKPIRPFGMIDSRAVDVIALEIVSKKKKTSMERDYKIISLLSDGLRSKEIAEFLNVTTRTAEHHISRIKTTFEAKSQAHLVRIAYEKGILK